MASSLFGLYFPGDFAVTNDIHWQKEYEIGITEIDNQHKNFLIRINNIHAYAEGKYKILLHEELLSTFSEMILDLNCTNTDVHKLHTFLLDWFKTHTITEDRKIREYEKTLT